MTRKHIEDCTEYFYYGKIDEGVIADSFYWEKEEEIDLSPVLEFIKRKCTKTSFYIITDRICTYPLSTMDKYLKLWNKIRDEYDLKLVRKSERQEELSRFLVYFGMAEIESNQLGTALKILQKSSWSSCIISSDTKLDLQAYIDQNISTFFRTADCSLNFGEIINSTCVKDGVITVIMGCDGSTVNYFYS